MLHMTGPLLGGFTHKRPVMRKTSPCDDAFIMYSYTTHSQNPVSVSSRRLNRKGIPIIYLEGMSLY